MFVLIVDLRYNIFGIRPMNSDRKGNLRFYLISKGRKVFILFPNVH